jgi:hypothetical protein
MRNYKFAKYGAGDWRTSSFSIALANYNVEMAVEEEIRLHQFCPDSEQLPRKFLPQNTQSIQTWMYNIQRYGNDRLACKVTWLCQPTAIHLHVKPHGPSRFCRGQRWKKTRQHAPQDLKSLRFGR